MYVKQVIFCVGAFSFMHRNALWVSWNGSRELMALMWLLLCGSHLDWFCIAFVFGVVCSCFYWWKHKQTVWQRASNRVYRLRQTFAMVSSRADAAFHTQWLSKCATLYYLSLLLMLSAHYPKLFARLHVWFPTLLFVASTTHALYWLSWLLMLPAPYI